MTTRFIIITLMLTTAAAGVNGQEHKARVHGTLRGKYEYQTGECEGRFEVRTARVSFTGDATDAVSYKAEVDLCDEGKIKMLDAYTRLHFTEQWNFTIGQMRVPFTIDAHRSPHQQYFANRSFIAKQVGNVRDVGACVAFSHKALSLQAGVFNGSGLTDQKDYWTKGVNFSAKAQVKLPQGISTTASIQKTKPNGVTVMMYDGGISYHTQSLHIEGEYLYKHYAHGMFKAVHAIDLFAACNINTNNGGLIKSVEPLVRYDFMTDYSDGTTSEDGTALKLTDHRRSRLTVGLTLHLAKPFVTDIRINYEKYFYGSTAEPKVSERDKAVIEFMTRF